MADQHNCAPYVEREHPSRISHGDRAGGLAIGDLLHRANRNVHPIAHVLIGYRPVRRRQCRRPRPAGLGELTPVEFETLYAAAEAA
jgi:hypothetical protein